MGELRFRGVLFEKLGAHGARVVSSFNVPWEESAIVDAFGDDEVLEKDQQQLFSAATYTLGANRGLAGLNVLHAAVLDRDCADVGEMDRTCEWLLSRGLAFLVYTSWSHRLPTKVHEARPGLPTAYDCFRLVVPYSRDITPDEHRVLVPALYGHEVPLDPPHYAREVAGKFVLNVRGKRPARPRGWDPCCSRPAQGYYVPTQRALLEVHQGAPIDVREVLARPTTAKVTARRQRAFIAPTATAVGALGELQRALRDQGLELGAPGGEGWCRSVCPACEDPSPSLTARANGDGVDLHCHAGCARRDIIDALGLDREDFRAPSELRMKLDEQLSRQEPESEPVEVDEAGEWLEREVDEALRKRRKTVVQAPAGTGKSYRCARSISKVVRSGMRICYATQEHQVAHETRMKLPPDVLARSVHIHSPLIQVGGSPVCERKEELHSRVFDFGVSLLGQVCPKCPKRNTCKALQAAKERARALPDALAVFVSHAGIRQVFGTTLDGEVKGNDTQLIVDEMPGTYERVEVTPAQLSQLTDGAGLLGAEATIARTVQEIARAWLAGEEPGEVRWGLGGSKMGDAYELALEWGRLSLREHAHPTGAEGAILRSADALVRLAAHKASGGAVEGLDNAAELGVAAMLPDACHEALVRRAGVLLSATPLMAALPEFEYRAQEVTDGAKVSRVMLLRPDRGSRSLTERFYDDETGVRVRRDKEPGEEPGIPWPWVDEALARALAAADEYGPDAKVLFCTFKLIADFLRADPARLQGRIEVAHYGALRGKNDWQEGAERECSVVYCFGTPRQAIMPTLLELGLRGEAAEQAWIAYAAGELAQAEGRLRLPRRKKPCTVIVEGDVAPLTWHPSNVDLIEADDRDPPETYSAELEAALLWQPAAKVARELGVDARTLRGWRHPGNPGPGEQYRAALRRLARPDVGTAMRLLSTMDAGRRATFRALRKFASLD